MGGGSSKAPEIKETAAERAAAELAAEKWQDYQKDFVPIENEYMNSVNDLNSESNKARVSAKAQANVVDQSSGLLGQAMQKNFARGIDPSSGASNANTFALSQATQNSRANAGNKGLFGAENAYLQGVSNVVALGNNQDATAFESMGSIADRASGEAINKAKNDFIDFQGNQSLTGGLIGAASAYGMDQFRKPTDKPQIGN